MRRWLRMAAAFAAAMLTACSDSDAPAPPGSADDGYVTLSLNIHTDTPLRTTRTDDNGHEEVGSDYSSLEDNIVASQLGFFIFAGKDDDAKLVAAVPDVNEADTVSLYGGEGRYTLVMKINKSNFEKAFGTEFVKGSTSPVSLRIITLANNPGTNPYASLPREFAETTYSDFMAEAAKLTTDLRGTLYNPEGKTMAEAYTGAIQMFGNQISVTTQDAIVGSAPGERLWLGDTNLLRSVAKVRVVDAIADTDRTEGYPKITSVVFAGTTTVSNQLPNGASTYVDGTQVHTANPAAAIAYATEGYNNFNMYNLPGQDPGQNKVWVGYVPEQTISEESAPAFKITMALSASETKDYTVSMHGQYEDNKPFDFGTEILRNHIYELQVTRVKSDQNIGLNWTVCFMDGQKVDIPQYN